MNDTRYLQTQYMKNVNHTTYLFLQDNADGWKKLQEKCDIFCESHFLLNRNLLCHWCMRWQSCITIFPALGQTETVWIMVGCMNISGMWWSNLIKPWQFCQLSSISVDPGCRSLWSKISIKSWGKKKKDSSSMAKTV